MNAALSSGCHSLPSLTRSESRDAPSPRSTILVTLRTSHDVSVVAFARMRAHPAALRTGRDVRVPAFVAVRLTHVCSHSIATRRLLPLLRSRPARQCAGVRTSRAHPCLVTVVERSSGTRSPALLHGHPRRRTSPQAKRQVDRSTHSDPSGGVLSRALTVHPLFSEVRARRHDHSGRLHFGAACEDRPAVGPAGRASKDGLAACPSGQAAKGGRPVTGRVAGDRPEGLDGRIRVLDGGAVLGGVWHG